MGVVVVGQMMLGILLVLIGGVDAGSVVRSRFPLEGVAAGGLGRRFHGVVGRELAGSSGINQHRRRSLEKDEKRGHPRAASVPSSSSSSSSSSSNGASSHTTTRTGRPFFRGDQAGGGGVPPGVRNISWAYRHIAWTLEDFPDPRIDPVRCGRRKASMVCDPSRLLTKSEGRKLDRVTAAICTHTGCPCGRNCSSTCPGYKVGVAVIPSAAENGDFGPGQRSINADAETLWAHNLRTQAWRMGTCSEDVILVLADREKKVFMSIGKQAKRKLTDACADSVYQDARHHLEAGRVGSALTQMVKDIKSVFHDDFKCEISFSQALSTGKIIGIIFGSIVPIILVVVILIFLGPWFGGRGFGGSSGSKHQTYHRRGYEPAETVIEGASTRGSALW